MAGRGPHRTRPGGIITAKGKYSLQLDGQGHAHTTPWAVGGSFGNGGVDVTHDFGIE